MKLTLKAARVNAGLSQNDVAEKINVSRASVNKWETGKTEIKVINLFALCLVYKVSPDDVILPNSSQNVNKGED